MSEQSVHEHETWRQHAPKILGAGALASGLGLMAYYASQIYAVAPLLHLSGEDQQVDNYLRSIPGRYATATDEIALRRIMGVKMDIQTDVQPCADDERMIVSGNHPTGNGVVGFGRFITDYLAPHMLAVGKIEHMKNPLLGWPLRLARSGVFIDRTPGKNEEAIAAIREACNTIFTPKSSMVVFPDRSRPTRKRIQASREKWSKRMPDAKVEEWMLHTLFPYSGGLHTILEGTSDVKRRIIDVTIGFNRPDETVLEAGALVDSTLHIRSEDVTDQIPIGDIEALREWLIQRWIEKNRMLDMWKKANQPRII